MVPSLRALLDGVIDYAGLFPPARLPLGEAVRNYLRYRRDPDSWMLARFVCPSARLDDLGVLLQEIGPAEAPVPLAVLGRGGDTWREFEEAGVEDARAILAFRQRFGGRIGGSGLAHLARRIRFHHRPRRARVCALAPHFRRPARHGSDLDAGQPLRVAHVPGGRAHHRRRRQRERRERQQRLYQDGVAGAIALARHFVLGHAPGC